MGKSSKNKKSRVPKITEEEYAAYVSAIKAPQEQPAEQKKVSGDTTAPKQIS